jgi:hypothetical protein
MAHEQEPPHQAAHFRKSITLDLLWDDASRR